jgi:hypothetical protein
MAFVEWNQEIETFATETAAQSLAYRVRLRGAHQRRQNPYTQICKTLVDILREDAVAVVDEEAIRMIVVGVLEHRSSSMSAKLDVVWKRECRSGRVPQNRTEQHLNTSPFEANAKLLKRWAKENSYVMSACREMKRSIQQPVSY